MANLLCNASMGVYGSYTQILDVVLMLSSRFYGRFGDELVLEKATCWLGFLDITTVDGCLEPALASKLFLQVLTIALWELSRPELPHLL